MNKNNILLLITAILLTLMLVSCTESRHKVLIVSLANSANEPSSVTFVKASLEKGGYIILDVETARQIDTYFSANHVVTDDDNNYFTRPALLNFVGGQGWNFQEVDTSLAGVEYIFTK